MHERDHWQAPPDELSITERAQTHRRRDRGQQVRPDEWRRLWARHGLAIEDVGVFAPDIVDLGCGRGEAVVHDATTRPDTKILAVDLYRPGLIKLMRAIEAEGLTDIAVVDADARDVVGALGPGSVHQIRSFFPDPWPKRRHGHRRLFGSAFTGAVVTAVSPGGTIQVVTDDRRYADDLRRLFGSDERVVTGPALPVPETFFRRRAETNGRAPLSQSWRRR